MYAFYGSQLVRCDAEKTHVIFTKAFGQVGNINNKNEMRSAWLTCLGMQKSKANGIR